RHVRTERGGWLRKRSLDARLHGAWLHADAEKNVARGAQRASGSAPARLCREYAARSRLRLDVPRAAPEQHVQFIREPGADSTDHRCGEDVEVRPYLFRARRRTDGRAHQPRAQGIPRSPADSVSDRDRYRLARSRTRGRDDDLRPGLEW